MRKYRKSLLSTTIFIGNTFCFPFILKYFLRKCLVKLDIHREIESREIGTKHLQSLSSIKYDRFSIARLIKQVA